MSDNDKLKDFIDKESTSANPDFEKKLRERIKKSAKRAQGTSDFAEFGFIKIWSVLLEIFSKIFAHTTKKPSHKTDNNRREQ